ncbi:MAG: hypothetical protein WC047_00020 [Kiritimatiellales bacterium]
MTTDELLARRKQRQQASIPAVNSGGGGSTSRAIKESDSDSDQAQSLLERRKARQQSTASGSIDYAQSWLDMARGTTEKAGSTYGGYRTQFDEINDLIRKAPDVLSDLTKTKRSLSSDDYAKAQSTLYGAYSGLKSIRDQYSQYPTQEDYANALDQQANAAKAGINTTQSQIAQVDEAMRNEQLNPVRYPSLFTVKATTFNRDAYRNILENPELDDAARKRIENYNSLSGYAGYESKTGEPETIVPQKNAELDGTIMWVLGLNGQRDYYEDDIRFGLRDIMTKREVSDFNAVYNTQGRDAAIQYISDIMPDLMETYNRTGTVAQKNKPDYQAQKDTATTQQKQYESDEKNARMAKYQERPYWPGFTESSQPLPGEENELLAQVMISTSRILDASRLSEGFVDRDVLALMSDAEKGTYYNIKHNDGKDAAIQYLDDMASTLGERYTKARMAESAEYAATNPVAASAKSVLQNIAGSVTGGLTIANSLLTGELPSAYSPGFSQQLQAQAARGAVSADMPVWGQKAYDIGMSVADSAAAGVFGPGMGAAIMGTRAAASTMQDSAERGLTYDQAVKLTIVNGLAEILTERVEFGRVFGMMGAGLGAKQAALRVLKNAFSEFGEESLTEFIDIMADKLVAEDKSIWETKLSAYQAEGMDAETAQNRVMGDFIAQIGEAGVAGFVSGGFLSGITASIDAYSETANTGADIRENSSVDALIAEGLSVDPNSRAYKSAQRLQSNQSAGQEVSDRAIGKQFNANTKAIKTTNASAIKTRLEGQTNAKAIADALIRATEGKALGNSYAQLIAENDAARALLAEMSNTEVAESVTAKEVQAIAKGAAGGQIAPVAVTRAQGAATPAQQAQTAAQPAQAVKTPFTGFSGGAKTISAIQDGQPVTITGVSSTNGDTVFVTLDNGYTADVSDLSFADENTAALYSFAAEYEGQAAATFVYGFSGSTPLSDYAAGFQYMYKMGKVKMPFAQAYKQMPGSMTEAEAMAAHAAGTNAAENAMPTQAEPVEDVAQEDAPKSQAPKPETEAKAEDKPAEKKYKPGLVRSFNFKTANLSETSKIQLRVIDALAKRAGIAVVVSDKLAAGKNGYYNHVTNELVISLNAIDGGYLYVAVHELTHYIQNNNAVEYDVLREFVLQKLAEQQGYDLEARIKELQAIYKAQVDQDLTRDEAIDEIVADGCASILTDETTVMELVKKNRTLAQKIADFFKDFYEELRDIVMRISERGHPESAALAQDVAAVREIYVTWMVALDNAVFDPNVSAGVAVAQDTEVDAADDAQYSVERDAEYMSAVESGDMDAAQRMVDEAAKAAGYTVKAYHGTQSGGFTVFDKNLVTWQTAFYFSDDRRVSETYADSTDNIDLKEGGNFQSGVYDVYLSPKNIRVIEAANTSWNLVVEKTGEAKTYSELTEEDIEKFEDKYSQDWDLENFVDEDGDELPVFDVDNFILNPPGKTNDYIDSTRLDGYDGLVFRGIRDSATPDFVPISDVYAMFNPERIKSSDPVTYDDSGNVIPLSQRFNASSNDIRYMLQGNTPLSNPDLIAENETLRQSVDLLQKQFELTNGPVMTKEQLTGMARGIVKEYKSKFDPDTLAANLAAISQFVRSGDNTVNWTDVSEATTEIARGVLEQSADVDEQNEETTKALKTKLRETKIKLNDEQKAQIKYYTGMDYEPFRRKYFGRIRFTEEGTPLDNLWGELQGEWPHLFGDVTATDEGHVLVNVLDSLQPIYQNPYGMDMDNAAAHLALRMFDEYLSLPAATFADEMDLKRKAEVAALRQQFKDRMKKLRADSKSKYDERLKALKAEEAAKRKVLSDQFKEATSAELKAKLRDQYRKLTDKRNADVAAKMAYYQAKQKTDATKRKESAVARKYRTRIEATAREMYDYMTRPSDKKHVPLFMRDSVMTVLELLDFGRTFKSGKRSGQITNKGVDWRAAVDALKNEIDNYNKVKAGLSKENADAYANEYLLIDPDMVDTIKQYVDSLTKTGTVNVADMNAEQLKAFYKIIGGLWHSIKNINRTWSNARYERQSDFGDALNSDLKALRDKRINGKNPLAKLDGLLNYDMLDSYSFGDRMGATGRALIDELDKGNLKKISRMREAADFTQGMFKQNGITGKDVRNWAKTTRQVTLESGKTVTMSISNMMEAHALYRRHTDGYHLPRGGMRIEAIDKGIVKGVVNQVQTFPATPTDLDNISSLLTGRQRAVMDAMQDYLSTTVAQWGNETSMLLYGYEKYTEDHYWPYRSDPNYMRSQQPKKTGLINGILNAGFTNPLVQGASNPIYVGDAFQTFVNHIIEMASYNGLAAPMEDALRVYNYVERIENADGTMRNGTSVKEQIERTMGVRGKAYFEKLIEDINGTSTGAYEAEISSALLSMAKGGMVMWRARVVIQQPTALMRATAMISPKYLAAAVIKKHSIAEMQKYAPIAWWKAQGGYDTSVGRSMRSVILGDQNVQDKWGEVGFWAAARADDVTWSHLWEAVKLEVAHENPALNKLSSEFLDKASERFTDIVNRTQVVDSVMHRSQIMRSENGFAKMATMFMSEPTKAYNLARSAFSDVANKNSKTARRRLARATYALAVTSLTNAIVLGLYDAWRKRDKDETFWESFLTEFMGWDKSKMTMDAFLSNPMNWGGNLGDELSPLRYIPYGRDILSMMQGFDMERTDMALIGDMKTAIDNTVKYFDGTSKYTPYKVFSDLTKTVSPFVGFPVSGLLTTGEDVVNGIAPGTIQTKRDTASATTTYQKMYDMILSGDKAGVSKTRTDIRTISKNADLAAKKYNVYGFAMKSDAEIDKGIAAILSTSDTRIADMYAAFKTNDASGLARIRSEVMKAGFTKDMVDQALVIYRNAQTETAASTDLTKTLSARLYSNDDLFAAIRSGKSASVSMIYKEMLADSSAADPEASIRSSAVSEFKPEYVKLYDAGSTAKMETLKKTLVGTFGVTEDQIFEWLYTSRYTKIKESIESGDVEAAQKYVAQARTEFDRYDSSIASSVTSKFKPLYVELINAGRTDEAQALASMLSSLGLKYKNGGNMYNSNTFKDWLK